jgi:hypothetical protein
LKGDDLDSYLLGFKCNIIKFEKSWRAKRLSKTYGLLSKALKHNAIKIATYVAKNSSFNVDQLRILFDNYNFTKKKLLFDLLLFAKIKFSDLDYEKLFILLAKQNDWDIIDYLHAAGYKVKTYFKSFMKYVSNDRYEKLEKLGYDIGEQYMHNEISNKLISDDTIFNKLNAKNISKYLDKLILNRGIGLFSKLIENNLVKINEKNIKKLGKASNFEVLTALSNNKLIGKNINALFLYTEKNTSRKKSGYRYRYTRYRKSCKNAKLKRLSFPKNFETNMLVLLDKIKETKNKINLTNVEAITNILVRNKFFILLEKLKNLGFNCKLSTDSATRLIHDIIYNDEAESLKTLIEIHIVSPQTIIQKTEHMDYAIQNNSVKCVKFFYDDLKMICGANILSNIFFPKRYYGSRFKTIDILTKVKILETIKFPFTDKLVEYACTKNNMELLLYCVNNLGLKTSNKNLDVALEYGNIKICEYLVKNGHIIEGKFIIDKVISFFNKFEDNKIIRAINFCLNNFECKASARCLKTASELNSVNVFKFVKEKFKLKVTPEILDHIIANITKKCDWYYWGHRKFNYMYGLIKYVVCDLYKQKIKLSEKQTTPLIKYAISSNNNNILSFISSKTDYKFTNDNLIMSCNSDNKIFNKIIDSGIHITHKNLDIILNTTYDKCAKLKYIHKNASDRINLHEYFSKKKINEFIISTMGRGILDFCWNVLNMKMNAYTLKLYVSSHVEGVYGPTLLNILNNIESITQEDVNKIIEKIDIGPRRFKKEKSKILKRLGELKVEDYIPSPDEIPENINLIGQIINDVYDDFIDIDGKPEIEDMDIIDEAEKIIREEEKNMLMSA